MPAGGGCLFEKGGAGPAGGLSSGAFCTVKVVLQNLHFREVPM
jgi:hypothetical protein